MACIITYENKQYTQKEFEQYFKEHFTEFVGEFITTKPDVILPIGTSGSGKSTFIKSLPQENLVVIEPDAMRVEFTGDMNDKSKDKEIYIEAAKRAVKAIKQGKQVVFDTTNLTKEKRLPFIEAIKKEIPNANIQYKLMPLNPELAKKRIKADIEKQIDTFEIRLDKPRFNPDNYEAISYPIKINNKYAGVISTDKDGYISSSIGMAGVELEKEFQGKGYGTKIYIALAKQLAEEGKILKSEKFGKDNINRKANNVWQSLINKGYAKDTGDYYEFINKPQRANVPDSTIDRHAESYKQMLEDIKSEPITKYKELGSKQDIEGFKDFVNNNEDLLPLTQNQIDYVLKSVSILQSDKAKQIFEKGRKNLWSLDKILTELAIPKEQKQLVENIYNDKINSIIKTLEKNCE